jgi:hypothetical protein
MAAKKKAKKSKSKKPKKLKAKKTPVAIPIAPEDFEGDGYFDEDGYVLPGQFDPDDLDFGGEA